MRILQLVVRYPPHVGGVERTVHELSRGLVSRGHAVRVLCAAEPEGPSEIDGVEVERIRYVAKLGNTNICPGLYPRAWRETADVVHSHLPTAGFPEAAVLVAYRRGIPHVLTYNNDLVGDGFKGLLGSIYNRAILPLIFRGTDRVAVTSPEYVGRSRWLTGVNAKVEVIPWGVDTDRFRPAPLPPFPPIRIGFLSVLDDHHAYKGLDLLLAAIAAIPVSGRGSLRLVVGGSGPSRPHYEEVARKLGIGERVEFIGLVPEAELPEFYQSLHVFALPSTDASQEGFGLVLLEAMASGRAVIASDLTGPAQAVRESAAGFVVPSASREHLREVIQSILDDPAQLDGLGAAARQLAQSRYCWNRIVGLYENLYTTLADREQPMPKGSAKRESER